MTMGDLKNKLNINLIKATAFFAILAVLMIAASLAVKPRYGEVYDISKTNRKHIDLKDEKTDIDVVFSGDSVVYRSISPLQIFTDYGFTSYDLSDSALRLCDAVSMVETSFDDHAPRLVVLETNSLFTDSVPHKDKYAIPTNFIENLFPILHYHVFYKTWLPDFSPEKPTADEHKRLKGFEYSDSVIPYDNDPDYMDRGPSKENMSRESLKYLNELYAFTKENNTDFLLISVPRPVGWNNARHDAVAEWARENSVPYIDLNKEDIGFDWNLDTMDGGDHMSFEGSKKVSNYLGKYIMENYSMDDHRGDSKYEDWNNSYREAGIY